MHIPDIYELRPFQSEGLRWAMPDPHSSLRPAPSLPGTSSPGLPALPLPIAPSSPSHHKDREGALPELPARWLGADVALSFLKNWFCGISTYFLLKAKGLLWGLTQGLTV